VADEPERNDSHEDDAPHVPASTIGPFVFALGIALLLLGLIVSWTIAAIGGAIAVIAGFFWMRDATRELRGLPAGPPPSRTDDEVVVVDEEGAPRYPRNVFLEGATLGIGAAIGVVVTLPALGFMVLPAFTGQEYDPVDLGPLDNFPPDQFVIAKFKSVKNEPEDVSRRTVFVRNNGETKDGQPSFTLISNRCVHLGCPVQPQGLTEEPKDIETDSGPVQLLNTAPNGFGCPCHGGAYDTEGNRTAGPPVRALDRYEYSIVNGSLVLGTPFSVAEVEGTGADAVMKSYKIVDPGQHVDGLEAYFYPYVP
jgi:menaquinol-cytochrome c reductase iron-sulfur subunit